MLFSAFQELERFTTTFLAQLLRTFEVTDLTVGRGGDRQLDRSIDGSAEGVNEAWPRNRIGKVTHDEGKMKFSL